MVFALLVLENGNLDPLFCVACKILFTYYYTHNNLIYSNKHNINKRDDGIESCKYLHFYGYWAHAMV